MKYILLNKNNYVIQTSHFAHEGWVKIEEDIQLLIDNAQFLDCCRYIDGQLIYDQEKHQNYLDDIKRREEEQASIPTPQQEIEKLKTENAELKKYVELISDSVVDLAMRTLKEV